MNAQLRFGHPRPYDFDTILDQFSGTKINSFRTSSVPLVQFWKETETRLIELYTQIGIVTEDIVLCFEYPTKPKLGKGKSSMTDLMILGDNYNIAIEAKFTEYSKMQSDQISKWKFEGVSIENRENVLKYWVSLIEPFSNGLNSKSIENISYQFFHRTASACKSTDKAFVIYQLFYDAHTFKDLEKIKSELREDVLLLNPTEKLSFYIWEIEVEQRINETKDNDPFKQMKTREVYEILKTNLYKI